MSDLVELAWCAAHSKPTVGGGTPAGCEQAIYGGEWKPNWCRVVPLNQGIPPEVLALCRFWSPITEARITKDSYYLTTLGLELRFVRTIAGSWEWDEIVGPCSVHVEQMADNYYWIGFNTDEGRVCVDIGARRAPVRMTGWTESESLVVGASRQGDTR